MNTTTNIDLDHVMGDWECTCYDIASLLAVIETSISYTSQTTEANDIVSQLAGYQALCKLLMHRLTAMAEEIANAQIGYYHQQKLSSQDGGDNHRQGS